MPVSSFWEGFLYQSQHHETLKEIPFLNNFLDH